MANASQPRIKLGIGLTRAYLISGSNGWQGRGVHEPQVSEWFGLDDDEPETYRGRTRRGFRQDVNSGGGAAISGPLILTPGLCGQWP